jgi:hypothetical protein
MAIEITLLYLTHALAWFCLSALVAIARGQSNIMKISSAVSMAMPSAVLHVLLRELGRRNF